MVVISLSQVEFLSPFLALPLILSLITDESKEEKEKEEAENANINSQTQHYVEEHKAITGEREITPLVIDDGVSFFYAQISLKIICMQEIYCMQIQKNLPVDFCLHSNILFTYLYSPTSMTQTDTQDLGSSSLAMWWDLGS